MPEADGSPAAGEPTTPPAEAEEAGNPLLSRVELQLPDGRYLLVYRHLEPASADA